LGGWLFEIQCDIKDSDIMPHVAPPKVFKNILRDIFDFILELLI
jgi:hypothetical protein